LIIFKVKIDYFKKRMAEWRESTASSVHPFVKFKEEFWISTLCYDFCLLVCLKILINPQQLKTFSKRERMQHTNGLAPEEERSCDLRSSTDGATL
jgi:hypothetical protein